MPMSNSVIRRYTPPTCRLQILARSSPVSQWLAISRNYGGLSFADDLRPPQQQQVIIEGDRDQLEVLHEAVSTYAEFTQPLA